MCWYLQILFTTAANVFLWLEKRCAFLKTNVLVDTCQYVTFNSFSDTSNIRGTQTHSKMRLNAVLSCHLDPMGDQNDVPQYVLISVDILGLFGIFGTVPTYSR